MRMIRKGFYPWTYARLGLGRQEDCPGILGLWAGVVTLSHFSLTEKAWAWIACKPVWSFQHRCHHLYKLPCGKEMCLPLAHLTWIKQNIVLFQLSLVCKYFYCIIHNTVWKFLELPVSQNHWYVSPSDAFYQLFIKRKYYRIESLLKNSDTFHQRQN